MKTQSAYSAPSSSSISSWGAMQLPPFSGYVLSPFLRFLRPRPARLFQEDMKDSRTMSSALYHVPYAIMTPVPTYIIAHDHHNTPIRKTTRDPSCTPEPGEPAPRGKNQPRLPSTERVDNHVQRRAQRAVRDSQRAVAEIRTPRRKTRTWW